MTLAYEGRGTSGPPLILVHGYPLDRAVWAGQLEGLAALGRVIAVDLPGFGASPALSDGKTPTTMDAFADQILALADGLGFGKFVLAGLSMGGYVALALARRRPERLAALVLCDTRAEADPEEVRAARIADAERVLAEGTGFLVEKHVARLVSPGTLRFRKDILAAVKAMVLRCSPAGVAAALRGMAVRLDSQELLPRLRVPTSVVVGADDLLLPPAFGQRMALAIPGAELAMIAGAGHLAPLETPKPVNAVLAELLRQASR